MKKQFSGLQKEVRKAIDQWLEERFKYSQGSWTEIEIDIQNID